MVGDFKTYETYRRNRDRGASERQKETLREAGQANSPGPGGPKSQEWQRPLSMASSPAQHKEPPARALQVPETDQVKTPPENVGVST